MKNLVFFNVFQWSTFFVLGPPGDHFGEVLGLILEPLGTMLGHLGGQHGSKSQPSDQNVMSNFDSKFDVRFFGLTGSVGESTVAELRAPVQLFSWKAGRAGW